MITNFISGRLLGAGHPYPQNYPNYQQQWNPNNQYQYKKREYLFTKNELYFYKDLIKATENLNFTIFAKVRLADIIEPRINGYGWKAQFNKIQSKHIDFILCELPYLKPKIAIELDDSSHDTPIRQERDAFVDQALSQAGIPIIHTRSSVEIKEKIETIINAESPKNVSEPTAYQNPKKNE